MPLNACTTTIVVRVGAKDIKGLDRYRKSRRAVCAAKHECERPLRKEIGERSAGSSSARTANHPITIFVDVVVALAADVCKWRWRRKCRRMMYGDNDEWRHDAATSKKSPSPNRTYRALRTSVKFGKKSDDTIFFFFLSSLNTRPPHCTFTYTRTTL